MGRRKIVLLIIQEICLYMVPIYCDFHLTHESLEGSRRSIIIGEQFRWPNGVIPYTISNITDKSEISVILEAMQTYHDKTCVWFRPRKPTDKDWVKIQSGYGCSATVGKYSGLNPLTLHKACGLPAAIHEIGHILGLVHEHTRPDRDQYITVLYDNINPDYFNDYAINYNTDPHGMPYDINSIMHYNGYEFAKNRNKPTFVVKGKRKPKKYRDHLTKIDILKINKVYNCKNRRMGLKNVKEEKTNKNETSDE